MIMHTIVPDEILYAGFDDIVAPIEIHVNGVLMQVERISNDHVKIIRVCSPELDPYLNDSYIPGQIILMSSLT